MRERAASEASMPELTTQQLEGKPHMRERAASGASTPELKPFIAIENRRTTTPNPSHGGVVISVQGADFALGPPHDAQIVVRAPATAMSFSAHRSKDATRAAIEAQASAEAAFQDRPRARTPRRWQTCYSLYLPDCSSRGSPPFAGTSGASTPELTPLSS